MRARSVGSAIATVLLFAAASAIAQTSSTGSLNVTASVQGSINLTFNSDASGITVSGAGTANASLPFGSVQMYGGTVPPNVTRTLTGTTSFSVSTPFAIRVDKANTASASYTLTATLQSSDSVNSWTIDGNDISAGTGKQITSTGAYDADQTHTIKISIPATNTTGSVANTVNFGAVAN